MIHPNTELRFVNDAVGYGVFARTFIPRGTITYVTDPLDLVIQPDDPRLQDPRFRPLIIKYASLEPNDAYLIAWDIAKHMNHHCLPPTLSTPYGFDIAVSDIQPGEEMTDDYAQVRVAFELDCLCGDPSCRKHISPLDFDRMIPEWDTRIIAALSDFEKVPQPLLPYLDESYQTALFDYLRTGKGFWSTSLLKQV